MRETRFNADDRIHLVVNIALMLGVVSVLGWIAWSTLPLSGGPRVLASVGVVLVGWIGAYRTVPRITGPVIERLSGSRIREGGE